MAQELKTPWLDPAQLSPISGMVRDPAVLRESGAQFLASLGDEGGARVIAVQGGLAVWAPSPWDSDVLERAAAVLRVFTAADPAAALALGRAVADDLSRASIKYAVARLPSPWVQEIQGLEAAGFRYVDGILTFQAPIADLSVPPAADPRVRLATPADADALAELGATCFVYDRFHNDPMVARTLADRLHGTWVRNSVLGRAADFVVTADSPRGPVGFVTVKMSQVGGIGFGTVVLVAVAPEAAGRGLAKAMSWEAMRQIAARGGGHCRVGTQIANIPASAVYLSLGLRLVATSVSLRWSPSC